MSQSVKLAEKLQASNVPYIYVPFEGQFHAFDFFQDNDRAPFVLHREVPWRILVIGLHATGDNWRLIGRREQARKSSLFGSILALALLASSGSAVRANEGGVSFWLPGSYGSLAASRPCPDGRSRPSIITTRSAPGKSADFVRGGRIEAGLNTRLDFLFVYPIYVFATPVFGGQASLSMEALVGPEHDVRLWNVDRTRRRFALGKPKQFPCSDSGTSIRAARCAGIRASTIS